MTLGVHFKVILSWVKPPSHAFAPWAFTVWAFGSNIQFFIRNVTISSNARKFSLSNRSLILITENIILFIYFLPWENYDGTFVKEKLNKNLPGTFCPKGLLVNSNTPQGNCFIWKISYLNHCECAVCNHHFALTQWVTCFYKTLFQSWVGQQCCNIKRD